MKTELIKTKIPILCLVFLLFTGTSKKHELQEEFAFRIDSSIEAKINLECTKGCAWRTLNFDCNSNNCNKKIDQFGIYREEDNTLYPELANFLIQISRQDNEYSFECSKGCAWSKLSISLPDKTKEHFIVNDRGLNLPKGEK